MDQVYAAEDVARQGSEARKRHCKSHCKANQHWQLRASLVDGRKLRGSLTYARDKQMKFEAKNEASDKQSRYK